MNHGDNPARKLCDRPIDTQNIGILLLAVRCDNTLDIKGKELFREGERFCSFNELELPIKIID